MGIHVVLDIDPRGMEEAAWAAVYEETRALLEAWQPRLMGWGTRLVEGVRVPMYARALHHEADRSEGAHWSVTGDLDSLHTAERQSIYRDLSHYTRQMDEEDGEAEDIIVAAARPERDDTGGPVRVFGDKTQGCPYHFAMLAAGMLVEERFAGRAMVWGDFDRGQAEEARRLAAPILGRELPLPVRVDSAHLIERLRGHYPEEELPAAFERLFLEEVAEEFESLLRAFPGEEGSARHWQHMLAQHEVPNALGALRLLMAWLNTGRELREACRLACLDPRGPRFPPEAFVDALAETWVAIPRSIREPIDAVRKPRGAPDTVHSMMGYTMLDMGALGRHLRIYLEPAVLLAELSAAFGEQGPRLAARLQEKSAKLEGLVREVVTGVAHLSAKAEAAGDDYTEFLPALRSMEDMGPTQRMYVQAVTWKVATVIQGLRADPRAVGLLPSPREARQVLARTLSHNAPVLREDTWDWLLTERDMEVLTWAVALATMHDRDLFEYEVCRAFFENAELRRYMLALSHDEQEMARISEIARKARESQDDP
jgi:hypothetical protein